MKRLRERLSQGLSGIITAALIVVPIALITLFVITLVSGEEEPEPQLGQVQSADSSWILGQSSLVAYPDYQAIAELADELGNERFESYQDLLAYIEAQREKEAREKLIRQAIKLLQECEEARRAYQAELVQAERERKREERAAIKEREKIKREIERLREKHKIEPGDECNVAEIAELFRCTGSYPIPKPKLPPLPPPPPPPPPPAPCELPPILRGVDLDKYT